MSSHLLRRRDLPFQKDLKILVGDNFISPVVRLMGESGEEMSLFGYTVAAELRISKSESSTKVGDFSVDIDGGGVELSLSSGQTAALSGYTLLYYDVRYTDPDGVKTTYWGGYVNVVETVTV